MKIGVRVEKEVKIKKNILNIFFEGFGIYLMNFRQFIGYMAFPVLGQLLGLFLTFLLVFGFSSNLPYIIEKYPLMDNFSTIAFSIVILTLPGLFIVTKALWDYIIAYSALNSMAQAAVITGKVYDFKAHNDVAYSKIAKYIALWILFGIYTIVAAIPIFFLLWIFLVYFVMIFQVFTFESKLSPAEIFQKSFELSKGHFVGNLILMLILGLLTFYIMPLGVTVLFDFSNLTKLLTEIFAIWSSNLPLEQMNMITTSFGYTITAIDIAKILTSQVAAFLAIGFTLPLRSICWTLRYENLNGGFEDLKQKPVKKKKRITKTPSKKITKTPSFKIETRKIDPEIIRRARMEDDEY